MNNAAALSTGLSVGRIVIGLGLIVAPDRVAGPWIGRAAKKAPTQIMARGLGARDVAIGVATIGTLKATGTRGMGFTVLTAITAVVDLVDVVSTAAASSEVPGKGIPTMAIAAGAAAGGIAALVLARSESDA